MTYGLNSSFKRQLNNKSKNKRLLAVIILVLIIVFSIVLTDREGGATPEELVKGWMKAVRKNEFEKMFDYIYYDNKKDNLDKKYLINDGRSFLTVEKHKGKWFLKKNQLW